MLILLWLMGITTVSVSAELIGDHICEVEKRYPVNITEYSLKNVTQRNYKWCMGFPPRCSFYTFKTIKVPQVVETSATKTVRECCPGYAENESRSSCMPCGKCLEGICSSGGKCICNPGFQGEDCSEACQAMQWGKDCKYKCICERGSCNPRTGRCDCPSGWFGTRCELLCLEGFFGRHCIHRCNCGERELCNPETGECIRKSTLRQEHQTTRDIHYMTNNLLNISYNVNMKKSTPSLKIYHNFDMELSSARPSYEEKDTIKKDTTKNEKPVRITTTVYPISSSEKYKHKHSTQGENISKSSLESAERTTEYSVEVILSGEHIPLLNENESIESEERKNSRENLKIIETHKNTMYKIKSTPKNTTKIDMKHTTKLSTPRRTSTAKSNEKTSPTKNIHEKNRTKSNKVTVISSKPSSKHHSTKKTTPKKNHSGNESIAISRNFTFDKVQKTTPYSTKVSTNTPSSTQAITLFDSSTESMTTISTKLNKLNYSNSNMKTSKAISVEKSNDKNIHNEVEEDKLQILDTFNVLTSKETTTASSASSTTIESVSSRKNAVLPSTEAISSTKSFEDDISNDLLALHSDKESPLRETFDSHRSKDENYLSDEASGEFEYSQDKSGLFNHMSIAAAASCILVLVLGALLVVHHYKNRRRGRGNPKLKAELHQNYPGGPTVSVYTHSIFHTPLPDPPIFDNPVFSSPKENQVDNRSFQTHVVCSLNFPGKKSLQDEKEYTYDHPPSTGSYRAASIPEPPDINEPTIIEPVYDEIPSNERVKLSVSPPPSYKSSCIYVNTCGKTKF